MNEVKYDWCIYEDYDPFVKNKPNVSHTVVLRMANQGNSKIFRIPITYDLGMELIDTINEMEKGID